MATGDDMKNDIDNVKKFREAFGAFADEFMVSPFDFLYESDLQALLFSVCRKKLSDQRVFLPGGFLKVDDYKDLLDGQNRMGISTSVIKSEYPGDHRFDIALLDPDYVYGYEGREVGKVIKNDFFWGQPVRAAIELKYLQVSDLPAYRRRGFQRDIEKLGQYTPKGKFFGLAALCLQSISHSSDYFGENKSRIDVGSIGDTGIYSCIVQPGQPVKFFREK